MNDWFLNLCDLAICCRRASSWFLNPRIDHVYCICGHVDEEHIGKRISLEIAGFVELPGKPSHDEIKIARIMIS